MKKLLLLIVFSLIGKLLFAQNDRPLGFSLDSKLSKNDTVYCVIIPDKAMKKKMRKEAKEAIVKPEKSSLAFEFNCTPFGENPIDLTSLKSRWFISQHSTLRLGINLRVKNKNYDDGVTPVTEIKEKLTEFGIHPGYEYHLNGTERLSPYWGIELNYTNRNCEREYSGANTGLLTGSNGTDRGFSSFGMNFFAGADYYITRHIYVGVELGYGFESKKNNEVKLEDASYPLYTEEKEFDAGVNFNSAIRLGFYF